MDRAVWCSERKKRTGRGMQPSLSCTVLCTALLGWGPDLWRWNHLESLSLTAWRLVHTQNYALQAQFFRGATGFKEGCACARLPAHSKYSTDSAPLHVNVKISSPPAKLHACVEILASRRHLLPEGEDKFVGLRGRKTLVVCPAHFLSPCTWVVSMGLN